MEVIMNRSDLILNLDLKVTRNGSDVGVRFNRSEQVWLIAESRQGRWLLPIDSIEDGEVQAAVSVAGVGLGCGVYTLKLMWATRFMPKSVYISQQGRRDDLDEAIVSRAFAITSLDEEATMTDKSVSLVFNMSVITSGYDGLDAWERAVMLGKTSLSEGDWLNKILLAENASERMDKIEEVIKHYHSTADFGVDKFYVGQIGDSSTIFSSLDGSELIAAANSYRTENVSLVVTKWIYFIMIPDTISFVYLKYIDEGVTTEHTDVSDLNEAHSDVRIGNVTYNVYGLRAEPSSLKYNLKISYTSGGDQ